MFQGSTGLPAQTPLFTPGEPLPQDIELPSPATRGLSTGLQINPSIPCPKTSLCDLIGHTQSFISENQANHGVANKHGVLLKFLLVGLLNGAASPPVVIRMCPPLTTKNWAVYKPLLALGMDKSRKLYKIILRPPMGPRKCCLILQVLK